jgi:hypothetical protein
MAVTGVFAADFSAFDKAVKTSEANLEGLESAGGKVEKSLRLMTQSQEQLLDQIGASGGKIQELGTAAGETSGSVNSLTSSYRQFDGILQSTGINIGSQVKGLEDIANAAGKSATEIGLLGTAGLVVGTAMAAWNIGKQIGEVTGLTQAIEDLAASWMGLGNLAGETAGAKQDTINLAIARGAAETINYANAIKFLSEQGQIATDKQINWRDKLADSYRELRNLTDAQKAEIAIAQEAGATTEQLTNKYGIHANTLGLLSKETAKAAAEQAKLTAEHEKDLALAEKRQAANVAGVELMERDARLMADRNKFDAEQLAIQNQKLEAGKGYVAQMGEVARVNKEAADFDKTLVTEQAALEQSNQELIASFSTMTEGHLEAGAAAEQGTAQTVAGYQAVQQQVEITSDGVRGWLALMQATNRANAILKENGLFTTGSQLERIAAGNVGGTIGAFSGPSFASGVENFEGGLAKVHGGEVLANLPRGTSVFPKGSGFGGANVSNVFNLVDTESNLAKRVAEMIMRQIRAGTQLGTA